MLFKLSIKNMKKSFKDYAIYFLTLVLGVAIFYMFNSLDSQEAMLQVSNSTRDIIKLMISMLGYVSVFVAVVLGLLIVYANNFLIKRRKKEFLGYSLDDSFTETELESSIINNLQKFLMELRKRICFCCKTTTYSNRKRRLLYRFGILQLYIKMFCVD